MVYVSSVSVSPSVLTLNKGKWYYDTEVIVGPEYATCKCVKWESSKPLVASVGSESGCIYANSAGTAVIKATAIDGSGKYDTMVVTVVDNVPVTEIRLNRNYIAIDKGSIYQLSAEVLPENATKKTLQWTSNNSSIATVTNGVVYGKSGGKTSVYAFATDGTPVCAGCTVEVISNKLVEFIAIAPSFVSMVVGEERCLYASVAPLSATNRTVRWESSDSTVVEVDEYTGCIVAKAVGSATVYARAQDGSGEVGTCDVTVTRPIPVTSVSVCPSEVTIIKGRSEYIYSDVLPSNATNKKIIWQSDKTSVATVDSYGWVTGVSPGTATITAVTEDGSYRDSVVVNVVIDFVTIKPDGGSNKVVFESTGKEWYCINQDMIYNDENAVNSSLNARSEKNLFVYTHTDPSLQNNALRTYTDDEIKLLYAIDPYGVAHYVQKYADTFDGGLESSVQYKDRIFRLLFNREPKYFARKIDGSTWYETNDKSDLSEVQSESESVFGMHPIWDDYTTLQIIEAVVTIIDIALTVAFTTPKVVAYFKAHKTMKTIAKIFSFTASSIGSGFISASADEFIEKAFEETSLSWAYDIVSLYSSIIELVSDFDVGENYYQQVLDYCANKLNYNVCVEMQNGEKHQLNEISELLTKD